MNEAKLWAKTWREYRYSQDFMLDTEDIAADAFEAGFYAARRLDRTEELLKEIGDFFTRIDENADEEAFGILEQAYKKVEVLAEQEEK